MKAKKIIVGFNKVLFLLVTAMLIFPLSACAQKVDFLKSTVVPAAQGKIKVKKDKNNNYLIKIHIDNLAESNRMSPPKNAYIVWMVTKENAPQNIGKIVTSTRFLSKKLTATFETVSVLKPTKIFITAEIDPSLQYPLSEVILTTNNF